MFALTHLTAVFLFAAAAPELREPTVATPGVHPRDSVALVDGEVALALCGNVLRQVRVRVQDVDEHSVRLSAPCTAKFIVGGVPQQQTRNPRRAHARMGAMLRGSPAGPKSVTLRLGAERRRIERVRLGSTGYRLELQGGRAPVTLYECQSTDEARWELLWAGDMDGDGRLDLVLDASDAFDLSELRLYLSRGAEEDVDQWAVLRRPRVSP